MRSYCQKYEATCPRLTMQDVSSPEKLQQQALLGGLTQGAATQAYALLLAPALAGREGVQSAAVSSPAGSTSNGSSTGTPVCGKLAHLAQTSLLLIVSPIS